MPVDFSKWLIASDVDGTLNNKAKKLPKRNLEAITRFVDLGGNFTLASGRPVNSLGRNYARVPCNVPAVVLNGSGIYDFQNQKMLWYHTLGELGRNFVLEVRARFPVIEAGVFTDNYLYLLKNGLLSEGQMLFDKTKHHVCAVEEIPEGKWFKAVFWSKPAVINRLVRYSQERFPNGELNFMKTSPFSYEMVDGGVHKGVAVLKLAESLGVDYDHVAAIGDYYNDLDMLKSVGLPACAGQAPKDIHAICKFEACHCNHGCVADLIEFIEKLETGRLVLK